MLIVVRLSHCQDLDDLGDHFHLPLSEEAFGELLQLQTILHYVGFSEENDQWLPFSSSSVFKVSKAYKMVIGTHIVNPAIKWLWKTCCQYKHKVFFGLLLNDRLNSRELLQRKCFFLPDYSCVRLFGYGIQESSIDEVLPRQCPCLRAFKSWRERGIRRTRRRSNKDKGTREFTQVRPLGG
jgi:hypothetical protein